LQASRLEILPVSLARKHMTYTALPWKW